MTLFKNPYLNVTYLRATKLVMIMSFFIEQHEYLIKLIVETLRTLNVFSLININFCIYFPVISE